MQIKIELGSGFHAAMSEASSLGRRIRLAASRGLLSAVVAAAANVVENHLSGSALKVRTGALRRAIDGWMEGDLDAAVGVREPSEVGAYSWLLTSEEKTITPRNGKFLAIPIGENLTGAGVARFSSPRQVPDGFFVRTHGRLLFGRRNGTKGKFRPLFTLVKSVFIQGSDALYDGTEEAIPQMTAALQAEVDKEVGS